MNIVENIGFVAAILTTASFSPQVVQVIKTKKTRDISLVMFGVMTAGILMWFVYGVLIISWPVIIANAISFIFSVIILIYKIRYK